MISGWISYSNQLVLGIIFTLMLGVLYALQPFLTSLCYEFINHGIDVNFGLARGIGSICCSFVSATVGYLILLFGSDCILWCLFLMFVLLFILVITFTVSGRHKHTHSPIRFRPHAFERRRSTSESGKESGALDFMRRNKTYTIFLLGCCLFMTAYQSINSYLINIATNVGGDSSTVGVTLGIAAAVELPVMACFSFIMKRFSCTRLLRFSSFFYILKAAGMLIAANPAMIYMAALMQMGSFAVFLPASTHFANIAVAPHDRVKAQALLSASTVGLSMTIGSLFGGTIIDQLGVRFLLLFCVIIAAMGFLLTCYVTKKVEKTQEAAL